MLSHLSLGSFFINKRKQDGTPFYYDNSNGPGKVMVLSKYSYLSWPQCKDKVTKDWALKWGRPLSQRVAHQCDASPSHWWPPSWLPPTPAVFWPWLWAPFMLQADPRRSGFITAFGGRSCQSQLGHWKEPRQALETKYIHFFSFLVSLPFRPGPRKSQAFSHLVISQSWSALFVKLTLMLFTASFPYQNMNLPMQNIFGFDRKSL